MTIRRADRDDLDLVASLRCQFLCDVRGVPSVSEELKASTAAWMRSTFDAGLLAAWLAGESAGVVAVVLHAMPPQVEDARPYDGYVINMYVPPAHRRAGIGRSLMAAVLDAAPSLGVRRFILQATEMGRPLYESAGFTVDDGLLQLHV